MEAEGRLADTSPRMAWRRRNVKFNTTLTNRCYTSKLQPATPTLQRQLTTSHPIIGLSETFIVRPVHLVVRLQLFTPIFLPKMMHRLHSHSPPGEQVFVLSWLPNPVVDGDGVPVTANRPQFTVRRQATIVRGFVDLDSSSMSRQTRAPAILTFDPLEKSQPMTDLSDGLPSSHLLCTAKRRLQCISACVRVRVLP